MTELTKPIPRRSPALERALWFAKQREEREEQRRLNAFAVARMEAWGAGGPRGPLAMRRFPKEWKVA